MKIKWSLIVTCAIIVAVIVCAAIFFSHNTGKVENLFNETIKALDTEQGLEELFIPAAKEQAETLEKDIDALNKFYDGKSISIEDYEFYRESNTGYRMYATVKTDKGEYFVCILGNGARNVDPYGISQIIIEDSKDFKHKKIFEKKEFDKYLDHADDYGVTIRVKDDMKNED